jgi:cytochrome P450
MLIYPFSGLFVLVAVYRLYGLVKNYLAARRLRLPVVILPVSCDDAWFAPLRHLFAWVESLPFGLGYWYKYTDFGWPIHDSNRTFLRLGETFILVTPTRNQICTCHPAASEALFKDLKTWILPSPFGEFFTIYGQNVSSLNGPDWQRHRKVTAPAFNDQTMRRVWEESLERTTEDLTFLETGKCTLEVLRADFSILAMNVLATVGFGQEGTALSTTSAGHRQSLMESLSAVLKNIFVMFVFAGIKAPPDFLLPAGLRSLKVSMAEFKMYMEEAVLRQLQAGKASKPSLLQAMVDANELEKSQMQKPLGKGSWLNDSELYGNLFVFNMAGFETTAGTMTFALPYLALNPDVQDWLTEEIDRYFTTGGSLDYRDTYPKLVRVMAFMYETLRLSGPAPQMLRTPTVPTLIPVASPSSSPVPSSITVHPGTLIAPSFPAMHLSERWGVDVHAFKPERFIKVNTQTGEEELATPADKGLSAAFMPWAVGPRVW